MSPNRKAAILSALAAGHQIHRLWTGGWNSGRLSHTLAGVARLREAEVDELRKSGLIERVREDRSEFPSFRLRQG